MTPVHRLLPALLLLAPGVAASTPPAAAPSHPAPAVALDTTRPADGTTRFRILVRRATDSAFAPVGLKTVTQRTTRLGGEPVVLRAIVFTYPGRPGVIDSTASVAATLAPIYERTYKPSGLLSIDFDGLSASGTEPVPGVGQRPFRDTLGEPAFNTTDLDLVVQSLPLADGYHATIPMYDRDMGRFRRGELRVDGTTDVRTPTGTERAWVVRVREPKADYVYLVSQRTRAMLHIDIIVFDKHVRVRVVPAD